jgi:hypothetical protein
VEGFLLQLQTRCLQLIEDPVLDIQPSSLKRKELTPSSYETNELLSAMRNWINFCFGYAAPSPGKQMEDFDSS